MPPEIIELFGEADRSCHPGVYTWFTRRCGEPLGRALLKRSRD